MSVSRARAIAFDVLRRVEAEGAYASDLLHAELPPTLNPKDAALATELVMGVLRWRRLLDFLLARQLKSPKRSDRAEANSESTVERLDLAVALALRVGLYQMLFLERVPARAAVNESVELVKRARKSSAGSLVNAVLRRIAGDATSTKNAAETVEALLADETPRAGRMAILNSHPTWLVERWLARFGEPRTRALLDVDNRAPRLSCALHDVEHRDEVLDQLAQAGLRIEPGALLRNAFAVSGGSVAAAEPFRRGAISIQDEASQAIPLLLGVRAGDLVLDLCAAPGGKTPPLVRAATTNGMVVAGDLHAHRLRAMQKQFKRLQLARVHSVALDAGKPLPFPARFDRILVDAPCSGTGTLARHPEIRWRLKPEQLAEFHRLQVAILNSALDALARGARVVYSTCSLEPEENEDVIADVLRGAPHIRIVPAGEIVPLLAPQVAEPIDTASLFDASGYFRTCPGAQATDGFFAAILEKQS